MQIIIIIIMIILCMYTCSLPKHYWEIENSLLLYYTDTNFRRTYCKYPAKYMKLKTKYDIKLRPRSLIVYLNDIATCVHVQLFTQLFHNYDIITSYV